MGSESLLNGRESGKLWAGWVGGASKPKFPAAGWRPMPKLSTWGGWAVIAWEQGPDLPDEGEPAVQL